MASLQLYAIVEKHTADRIAASRPLPMLSVLGALDLAAVVGPAPTVSWRPAGKAELGRRMVAFQRVLEALIPCGPMLPATMGAIFRDALEPTAFLVAHAATLRSALSHFGGLHQYQVLVSWDPQAMLRQLQGSDRLASLSAGETTHDAKAYANALGSIMESYRAELGRWFAANLREVTVDMLVLPPDGENGILNATVLIEPAQQQAFDAAIEAIDAVATEALRIKVAGPLPACAFASVTVEKPDRRLVEKARREIGGDAGIELAELKQNYRRRMRLVHPDMPEGREAEAAAASTSYELLRRISEAEEALRAQGMQPPDVVPLVRVLRADAAGLAA